MPTGESRFSDKLTRKEVDFVLRRASEIDAQGSAANEPSSDDALSVIELVRLGEEAGLHRGAIDQALT